MATLLGAAEALGARVYRWYGPDMDLRQEIADNVRQQLGNEAYSGRWTPASR